MELFSPSYLPGVGMGDLASVAAILGLIGLAVTSGALVAEGVIGTLVFMVAAAILLQEKTDFGGAVPATAVVMAALVLAVAVRLVLETRARRDAAGLVGAAADAPETKTIRRAVATRERWARILTFASVALAGATVGFAWAEWNEVPFRLEDAEAVVGLVLGLGAAAVGGDAAWRFVEGAVRAGGSAVIVGIVVVVTALALNAASVYVPFAGLAVLLVAGLLALRLRRRRQEKHAGLRILR